MHRSRAAVIDDDQSVRESLPDLLLEFDFDTDVYASAEEFLAGEKISEYACLILDIAMPGMSGLQLQRVLAERNVDVPIVFITAHADPDARLRLHSDRVECLLKPFKDAALCGALQRVLKRTL